MPRKKQPKNPQQHRETNDPSEDNIDRTRDIILSPRNHIEEDLEQEPEDVVEGNFEVGLADVGVEDEDIAT
jgi:hypothetical protein